jgi:hypothetical protein
MGVIAMSRWGKTGLKITSHFYMIDENDHQGLHKDQPFFPVILG